MIKISLYLVQSLYFVLKNKRLLQNLEKGEQQPLIFILLFQ